MTVVLQNLALDQPTVEIQYLRRIISPLPSMVLAEGESAQVQLPISLGPRADAELVRRGASKGFIMRALQARVHAQSRELFSFHLSYCSSWSVKECEALWELIELPCL